jgi:starch synthase
MDILIVTAELAPFCSTGEIGEAVSSLARAMVGQGHQVTIVLPRPSDLDAAGIMVARRLSPLELSNGQSAIVYDAQLVGGIPVHLVESATLEARQTPYRDADGVEYADNFQRLAVLAQVAENLVAARASAGKPFDAIMGQDLAGTLLPFVGLGIPTLLTIHDLTLVGSCNEQTLAEWNVLQDPTVRQPFVSSDGASLIRGGVLASDIVTCISPKLAQNPELAQWSGVAVALASAEKEVYGVPGGVDYSVHNPATDSALATRFDGESSERKGLCKTALLRELGMEMEPNLPLFCWVGEVRDNSGIEWLAGALGEILALPLNLVVALKSRNTNDGEAADVLADLASAAWAKLPNYRLLRDASPAVARRVISAADVAITGEQRVISGHACRVAQRYGAVPLAFDAPGAFDVIVDCDAQLRTGTGFLFTEDNAAGLLGGISRVLAATRTAQWPKLRRRIMRQDLGWERAARRYVQLLRLGGRKL